MVFVSLLRWHSFDHDISENIAANVDSREEHRDSLQLHENPDKDEKDENDSERVEVHDTSSLFVGLLNKV